MSCTPITLVVGGWARSVADKVTPNIQSVKVLFTAMLLRLALALRNIDTPEPAY